MEEEKLEKQINTKPVYLHRVDGTFIEKFNTTRDCADYFNKDREYINHNLKYCKKIRKNGKWFVIRREKIEK